MKFCVTPVIFWSSDDAWRLARAFLNREKAKADAGQESLLDVYKSLGYIDAEFVTDENGVGHW